MSRRHRRRRPPVFAIVMGLVVALGVVAIVLTRNQTTEEPDDVASTVTVTGEALAPQGADPDPAVGREAPRVRGTDFAGERMTIPRSGRPTAIVFLAHWCPHCQREVAALTAWLRTNELPSGVDFVSVSTLVDRTRGNYPPDAWLRDAGWPFAVLRDDADSSAADAYGLSSTPLWVFVDGEGRVAGRAAGELAPEQIAAIMEDLARTTASPSPTPR